MSTPSVENSTEDTTSLPWEVQRRPSFKASVAIYAVGLALFIGGGIFGAMIHLEHKPWFGFGVGAIMAALLIAGVRKGTIVSVDNAGMLTLNYGAKDNLRFHLSLIEDSTIVQAGNLRGVGLRLSDYTAIDFIHKSGHTFRSMEKLRREMGVDLVMEHLNRQDLDQILALRASCPPPAQTNDKTSA